MSLRRFDKEVEWKKRLGAIVVKLDVERNEIPFLLGAGKTSEARRPTLILEFTPKTLKASGYFEEELRSTFLDLGYETCASFRKINRRYPLSELELEEQQNVVVGA